MGQPESTAQTDEPGSEPPGDVQGTAQLAQWLLNEPRLEWMDYIAAGQLLLTNELVGQVAALHRRLAELEAEVRPLLTSPAAKAARALGRFGRA